MKKLYKLKIKENIRLDNIDLKENDIIYVSSVDNPLSKIITPEMTNWYYKRTHNHINLVQKYCRIIQDKFGDRFIGLIENARYHDKLKLEEPELTPYIIITWDYYCNDNKIKFDISDDIRKNLYKATEHHVTNSPHHPEYWQDRKENILDINSRDGTTIPNGMIDATKMPDIYVAEMCADFCSMSEERHNTPFEWFSKVNGIRWKFSEKQIILIISILEKIW